MQIHCEVTFSADTSLSLRTKIRTQARGHWFTDLCCHLLSRTVWTVDPGVGLSRPGSAGQRRRGSLTRTHRLICMLVNYKQQRGISFPSTKLNHVGGWCVAAGCGAVPTSLNTCEGEMHAYAHTHTLKVTELEEWLRVNNIWSPVARIPIRTSVMKHLPIKSNDACDLKGITVKWCIQRDYGHLQMAGVQESANRKVLRLSTQALSRRMSQGCFHPLIWAKTSRLQASKPFYYSMYCQALVLSALGNSWGWGGCTSINVLCEKWSLKMLRWHEWRLHRAQ